MAGIAGVPRFPGTWRRSSTRRSRVEPDRRYAAAGALADDLRRFLDGRTILARRASFRAPDTLVPAKPMGGRIDRDPGCRNCRQRLAGRPRAPRHWAKPKVKHIRRNQAEAATRKQRDRAEAEAEISKAVRAFVQQDMLAEADAAFNLPTLRIQHDPDLKVRTALDRSAAKIGDRIPRVSRSWKHRFARRSARRTINWASSRRPSRTFSGPWIRAAPSWTTTIPTHSSP